MSQIGESSLKIALQTDAFNKNIDRLTNQLWKLIPMKENNEDWEKQLDTLIIEITGLNLLYSEKFIQLLSKLLGLQKLKEIHFDLYRKTIFECIDAIQGLKMHD